MEPIEKVSEVLDTKIYMAFATGILFGLVLGNVICHALGLH